MAAGLTASFLSTGTAAASDKGAVAETDAIAMATNEPRPYLPTKSRGKIYGKVGYSNASKVCVWLEVWVPFPAPGWVPVKGECRYPPSIVTGGAIPVSIDCTKSGLYHSLGMVKDRSTGRTVYKESGSAFISC
ncbi:MULTISPECIES: hypothetical protein [Streptomyces]|uniref:Secreted protein n=1 Tax=Streptomyces chengmaiensis TaxID=3040919 RepID=A0ABT6HXB1_9ACTN|nr:MULTISPECIES: hypothetical protein [Streptomyces]MDH2392694.1 hypothetical protein [Streptomyces chengmaiensis]WRQ81047.1 hypothetical protein I3F59_017770 [Streptomyces sp. MUM 178J]